MAFTYVRFQHEIADCNKRMVTGTFSNSEGATGGNIYTGLHIVENLSLQHTGDTVISNTPSVKTTLPAPDPIEIVTDADTSGIWIATGE